MLILDNRYILGSISTAALALFKAVSGESISSPTMERFRSVVQGERGRDGEIEILYGKIGTVMLLVR